MESAGPQVDDGVANDLDAHALGPAEDLQTLAPWWHTAIVLAQLLALALIGPRTSRDRTYEQHVFVYTAGLMSQWLQLSAIIAGLYRRRQFFIDTLRRGARPWWQDGLLGCGLFVATMIMFATATMAMHGLHVQPSFDHRVMYAMAPKSAGGLLYWLVLCVAIGFSEELVFRGYLLRQAIAWIRRSGASQGAAASLGVVLTSVLFGSLHVYEGVGGAILIGVLGAMYAVVALWRGNLRAVIVAHVLQDFLTMVFVMMRQAHAAH